MNIREAKEDIIHTVRAYLSKNQYGQYRIPRNRQRPILLMGPPGIGKTQIMAQIASECEIGLVSYTITHHTRQSAVGLPYIEEATFDGISGSVTRYTMSEIIYSIYRYMEDTGRREGILFIDEINCVSETLAPTMLQFLQNKTFGNQAVPEGWIIVTAGNPAEFNKSVHEFDFVTLDRVRRIDISADLDAFRAYAREMHLHPFILSYLELSPKNFYLTENDVDGLSFVTARGWEDLSYLVRAYEELGIGISEEVVKQFLQHEETARDVAVYYNLYQTYRDQYDIRKILNGKVAPDIYARLLHAPFDERSSLVSLLTDGLHQDVLKAMEQDRLTKDLYAFLKDYRQELPEQGAEGGRFRTSLEALRKEHAKEEKTGLLTPADKKHKAALVSRLDSWIPDPASEGQAAFSMMQEQFNKETGLRRDLLDQAADAMSHAFSFMDTAFGESPEMVIFVTELTMDPVISLYIAEYGSEDYEKYSSSLLIGSRRADLLRELDKSE